MPRLAVLHTVHVLIDRFKTMLASELPEIDAFHMLDESVLVDLIRQGPDPAIERRVVGFARQAADAGADLIVFTCSSTAPAMDAARRETAVPILKIDDPMAERAVTLGRRIGILCTTTSTQGPSAALIREHAARQSREVQTEVRLVENAFAALSAGRREEHDALVSAAARELATRADVIVLAQGSLAHLQEPLTGVLPVPVLASPRLCVEAVVRHYRR